MKKYAIGIDIGGTHFRKVVIERRGKFLKPPQKENVVHTDYHRIIKKITESVKEEDRKKISCVGISIAGPVDFKKQAVKETPHLPFPKNFSLKKAVEKKLKIPVFIDNDMNCAAEAELKFGALKNYKNAVILTISTGVGSAIIIDGRIYRGKDGMAGEVGHLSGYVSKNGRIEALASGESLEERMRKALKEKKRLDALKIYQRALKGDKLSKKLIKDTAYWMGIVLANVTNMLNPEVIIMDGGFFLGTLPLTLDTIKRVLKQKSTAPPKLLKSKMGDLGGAIGAAILALKNS